MSIHAFVCFIHVHDMFVHTQGTYLCMSHVQLGIAVLYCIYVYGVHNVANMKRVYIEAPCIHDYNYMIAVLMSY